MQAWYIVLRPPQQHLGTPRATADRHVWACRMRWFWLAQVHERQLDLAACVGRVEWTWKRATAVRSHALLFRHDCGLNWLWFSHDVIACTKLVQTVDMRCCLATLLRCHAFMDHSCRLFSESSRRGCGFLSQFYE